MAEARNAQRNATRHKGTVVVPGKSEIVCTIRDLSATGARLSFAHPTFLPRTFRLRFDDQDLQVTVMWRRGLYAGVRFQSRIATIAQRNRRSWFWSRR